MRPAEASERSVAQSIRKSTCPLFALCSCACARVRVPLHPLKSSDQSVLTAAARQRWPFASRVPSLPSLLPGLSEHFTSFSSFSSHLRLSTFSPRSPPNSSPNPFARPSPFTLLPTPASNLPHLSFRRSAPPTSASLLPKAVKREGEDDSSMALPNPPSACLSVTPN